MSAMHATPKPLTGRFVLFTLLSFFGVVFAVNFVMMKLAIDTLPGTEVDSTYSASLGFGKEIAAARDQNARNWRVDADIQRGAKGDATLQVEAHDSRGAPISGLKSSVLRKRDFHHHERTTEGVPRRTANRAKRHGVTSPQRDFV